MIVRTGTGYAHPNHGRTDRRARPRTAYAARSVLIELPSEERAILASIHQPDFAVRWLNRAILLHDALVLADRLSPSVVIAANLSRLYGITTKVAEAKGGVFPDVRDRRRPSE